LRSCQRQAAFTSRDAARQVLFRFFSDRSHIASTTSAEALVVVEVRFRIGYNLQHPKAEVVCVRSSTDRHGTARDCDGASSVAGSRR
jgi:hypothetical protein